ncbi:MAG: tetratricopeptide repeat protein [bacterium]
MKNSVHCLIFFMLLFAIQFVSGQSVDEFIEKAGTLYQSGNLEEAVQLMEEAREKFPENSTVYSYVGFYRGMQAGKTQNFMEAGELIGTAYEHMNKAVELDPDNPIARFHRGVMGVNVPVFLGKLDQGIQDLEHLAELARKSPDQVPDDLLVPGYNFLGNGYQKKDRNQDAVTAWEKVIALAPGSDMANNAEKSITALTSAEKESVPSKKETQDRKYSSKKVDQLKEKIESDPDNLSLQIELGKAYIDIKNYEKAKEELYKVIEQDSTNIEGYKLLMETLGSMAEKGYDEKIYKDTNYRTNLAFEVSRLADEAVAVSPEDPELRLIRGSIDVGMPFFVGKLEQGIEDLNFIINSKADKEIKAEATYWLGMAYKKKAVTNWIKVITEYPGTDASRYAFQSMCPSVEHFNTAEHEKPFVSIDFILGFQDELAPQTVVWIEDAKGNFVKTVYVSGFSGYAKEKQVNLPNWSEASDFADVDGVTAASIDVGHHIYVWDLKDHKGNTVENGEYTVNIETAYWPSMEYQMVSAPVSLSCKSKKTVIEEGNLIPYVEVRYFAE